ncbi:MAG: toll/interleukin-1 receptor domain-containing protein [Pseudomonadota bacterium]
MAAPKIFVSYRRQDSAATSGRIRDRLAGELGVDRVFLDVDKIGIGEDFVTAIETEITRCQVMLVMIGRHWNDPEGAGARLHDDRDHVRAEIRAGLNAGLRVLPVLVDGAEMPESDALPDDLKKLSRLNAFEIRNARFSDDADRLAEIIAGKKLRRGGSLLGTALRTAGGGLAGLVIYVAIGIIHNALTGLALDAVLGKASTTLLFPVFVVAGAVGAFALSRRP